MEDSEDELDLELEASFQAGSRAAFGRSAPAGADRPDKKKGFFTAVLPKESRKEPKAGLPRAVHAGSDPQSADHADRGLAGDLRASGEEPTGSGSSATPQPHRISFEFPGWHVDIDRNQKTSEVQVHHHSHAQASLAAAPDGPDKCHKWTESALGNRTPLLSLPAELLHRILLRLGPRELCSLRACCAALHAVAGEDRFWRHHVMELQSASNSSRRGPLRACSAVEEDPYSQAEGMGGGGGQMMRFKLKEQSRQMAQKFQVLSKGFEYLTRTFERWWQRLQHVNGTSGGAGEERAPADAKEGWLTSAKEEFDEDEAGEEEEWSTQGCEGNEDVNEGEDGDNVSVEDTATVRRVVRKLTNYDWSLMYEALTQIFALRADLLGRELSQCTAQKGAPYASSAQAGGATAVAEAHAGSRGALDAGSVVLNASAPGAAPGHEGRGAEEVRSAAWKVVGEWETEWELDGEGRKGAPKSALLHLKMGHQGTTPEANSGHSLPSASSRAVTLSRHGGPHSEPEGHLIQSIEALTLWTEVVRLWSVYRRWIKLVSSHCTLLQFEVMLERARGVMGYTADTPTLYDKGVICFRSSVLLSYGNRRRFQHALTALRALASADPAWLPRDYIRSWNASAHAGPEVSPEAAFELVLRVRRLNQELDVRDDGTLNSSSHTQQKLRRCFGSLLQFQGRLLVYKNKRPQRLWSLDHNRDAVMAASS